MWLNLELRYYNVTDESITLTNNSKLLGKVVHVDESHDPQVGDFYQEADLQCSMVLFYHDVSVTCPEPKSNESS